MMFQFQGSLDRSAVNHSSEEGLEDFCAFACLGSLSSRLLQGNPAKDISASILNLYDKLLEMAKEREQASYWKLLLLILPSFSEGRRNRKTVPVQTAASQSTRPVRD